MVQSQNRAVDGDHVAIQLLEKKDWSAPAELILDDDGGKADPGDTLDDGDKSLLDRAVKKREDVQGRDHSFKLGSGWNCHSDQLQRYLLLCTHF